MTGIMAIVFGVIAAANVVFLFITPPKYLDLIHFVPRRLRFMIESFVPEKFQEKALRITLIVVCALASVGASMTAARLAAASG